MFTPYSVFLVPIAVGVLAEVVKFLNHCRKYGWDISYSITYGHMPSAHTAFAVSLATSVGLIEGMHSPTFGVAVCFAIIVVMDALRLRVYMGEHAEYINHIIAELKLDESKFPRLKERVGHKPEEVIAGAIFGFAITALIIHLIR